MHLYYCQLDAWGPFSKGAAGGQSVASGKQFGAVGFTKKSESCERHGVPLAACCRWRRIAAAEKCADRAVAGFSALAIRGKLETELAVQEGRREERCGGA